MSLSATTNGRELRRCLLQQGGVDRIRIGLLATLDVAAVTLTGHVFEFVAAEALCCNSSKTAGAVVGALSAPLAGSGLDAAVAFGQAAYRHIQFDLHYRQPMS
jgi:hypothetical protein